MNEHNSWSFDTFREWFSPLRMVPDVREEKNRWGGIRRLSSSLDLPRANVLLKLILGEPTSKPETAFLRNTFQTGGKALQPCSDHEIRILAASVLAYSFCAESVTSTHIATLLAFLCRQTPPQGVSLPYRNLRCLGKERLLELGSEVRQSESKDSLIYCIEEREILWAFIRAIMKPDSSDIQLDTTIGNYIKDLVKALQVFPPPRFAWDLLESLCPDEDEHGTNRASLLSSFTPIVEIGESLEMFEWILPIFADSRSHTVDQEIAKLPFSLFAYHSTLEICARIALSKAKVASPGGETHGRD